MLVADYGRRGERIIRRYATSEKYGRLEFQGSEYVLGTVSARWLAMYTGMSFFKVRIQYLVLLYYLFVTVTDAVEIQEERCASINRSFFRRFMNRYKTVKASKAHRAIQFGYGISTFSSLLIVCESLHVMTS